jgi:hypothetical protein
MNKRRLCNTPKHVERYDGESPMDSPCDKHRKHEFRTAMTPARSQSFRSIVHGYLRVCWLLQWRHWGNRRYRIWCRTTRRVCPDVSRKTPSRNIGNQLPVTSCHIPQVRTPGYLPYLLYFTFYTKAKCVFRVHFMGDIRTWNFSLLLYQSRGPLPL